MRRSWSAILSWAGIFVVTVGFTIANAQSGEHDFVAQAAMSNMAEIQLGHLAAKKAQDPEVKKFAQATIEEHVKAQQQLADAAYGAGIKWPTKLDDKNRQIQDRLSKLSNEQFDREYMKATLDRHRDAEMMLEVRLPTRQAAAAKPDELSLAAKVDQWVSKTLPDVRAHLKEAEQVYGGLAKGE